jgi:thymidylate synthase
MTFNADYLRATPALYFPSIYEGLLHHLLKRGKPEVNERTGAIIRALPHPTSFVLDMQEEWLPVPGNRKVFPGTAAAEVAWMLMGTQDATFMLKHARVVWEKFVEPIHLEDKIGDGGRSVDILGVKAAYGHRWRKKFGRDQIRLAVNALKLTQTDRRVWISAWDPAEDGLGTVGQLNVPCPVGFSLSVVDGRLNSALMLRSSDVFVGLPYDVMGHAILMMAIACELKIGLGYMHFTLAHPHLYGAHFEMAEESLMHPVRTEMPLASHRPIDAIVEDPDGFVELYKTAARGVKWPEYCPRPDVIP